METKLSEGVVTIMRGHLGFVTKVTRCETLFFYMFSFFSEKRIERTVTFVTATNNNPTHVA
jgi:hypothetical protein